MVPFHKAEVSVSHLYDWKNKLLTYGVKQNVRLIQPNVIGGSEDGKPALRYHCKDTTFRRGLLENSYFCSIANNLNDNDRTLFKVVICLKTRTFAVSQTTDVRPFVFSAVLWFAWKLVHLQYRKQLFRWSCNAVSCCDLLENSYFCSIANNLQPIVWYF